MYNTIPYTISRKSPLYLFTGYDVNLIPKVEDDSIEGEIPNVNKRIRRIKEEREALKAY